MSSVGWGLIGISLSGHSVLAPFGDQQNPSSTSPVPKNWLRVLFFPTVPCSPEVGVPSLPLDPETHHLLVLGQEWKQAVAELMLWMQGKWATVAGEPSQACSNILKKPKWLEMTKRELLATRGYMQDLQQVRMLERSAEPSCLQIPSTLLCLLL